MMTYDYQVDHSYFPRKYFSRAKDVCCHSLNVMSLTSHCTATFLSA